MKNIFVSLICQYNLPIMKELLYLKDDQLKDLIEKGRNTHVKACPECWNPDHPQLKLGEFPVNDPQAIRNPRSDSAELTESRDTQWGWNPVGVGRDPFNLTPNDLIGTGEVGTVTVTTS
jgi:hypothetical protein